MRLTKIDAPKFVLPKVRVESSTKRKSPSVKVMKVSVDRKGDSSIFVLLNLELPQQAKLVRKGLSSSAVVEVSEALDMPRSSFLSYLQLPRSTIEARIKNNAALTVGESDAVLRAAKALARAQEVFEDQASAASWMKRAIRSLGGVTPISLIDTEPGFEMVMRTLGRIEQGVVA